MSISESILKDYVLDPEAQFFIQNFNETSPIESNGLRLLRSKKILEVGAHDVPLSTIMCKEGWLVHSCDLRPYDGEFLDGHTHHEGDFLEIELLDEFDCAFSVSAIEHFGLGTYGENEYLAYADVLAMRKIWESLKHGGICYVLVPIGGKFIEVKPHWRVYDWASIKDRIIQNFKLEWVDFNVSEKYQQKDGTFSEIGKRPSFFDVVDNTTGFPGISCIVKMRK